MPRKATKYLSHTPSSETPGWCCEINKEFVHGTEQIDEYNKYQNDYKSWKHPFGFEAG